MSPYFINSFQNPLDKAIRLNETLIGEQWPSTSIVCHNSEWKMNRWNIDRGVSDCKSLISSSWPTDKSKQWQRNCKSHRMFLVCVPSTSLTVITNASTEEKIWWTRRFIKMHRLNGINIVTSSAGTSLARFMECLSSALVGCIGIFLIALIIIPLEIQREREKTDMTYWNEIDAHWCLIVASSTDSYSHRKQKIATITRKIMTELIQPKGIWASFVYTNCGNFVCLVVFCVWLVGWLLMRRIFSFSILATSILFQSLVNRILRLCMWIYRFVFDWYGFSLSLHLFTVRLLQWQCIHTSSS